MTVPRSPVQSSVAGVAGVVYLSTRRHQCPYGLHVTIPSSSKERSRPQVICAVHLRPPPTCQNFNDLHVAVPSCAMHGCHPLVVCTVNRPRLEKHLYGPEVPEHDCCVQCAHALVVCVIHLRPSRHQRPYRLRRAVLRRHQQPPIPGLLTRRRLRARVHVHALLCRRLHRHGAQRVPVPRPRRLQPHLPELLLALRDSHRLHPVRESRCDLSASDRIELAHAHGPRPQSLTTLLAAPRCLHAPPQLLHVLGGQRRLQGRVRRLHASRRRASLAHLRNPPPPPITPVHCPFATT